MKFSILCFVCLLSLSDELRNCPEVMTDRWWWNTMKEYCISIPDACEPWTEPKPYYYSYHGFQ